jgi:hypothetical protein
MAPDRPHPTATARRAEESCSVTCDHGNDSLLRLQSLCCVLLGSDSDVSRLRFPERMRV